MATFYLRVEGVNFTAFALDNSDLSTIRGAGLLLLDAVKRVPERSPIDLEPISLGASIGIFSFEADDYQAALDVRSSIAHMLDADPLFRHVTFVVAVTEARGSYRKDTDRGLACVRWDQQSQPTILARSNSEPLVDSLMRGQSAGLSESAIQSIVECDANSLANADPDTGRRIACQIDNVRKAIHWMPGPENKANYVSDASAVRRAYGRIQKRKFYADLLPPEASLPAEFAREFSEIGEYPVGEAYDKHRRILNGKIAVLYADGNRFGSLQQQYCLSREDQFQWDALIRQSRCDLMQTFFHERWDSSASPGWYSSEGRFQLETLLWGGDEVMWVLPAWQGWAMLFYFLDVWALPENALVDEQLTHAASLVFCDCKTPIHRVQSLVRQLADEPKAISKTTNLAAYEVLESFDHTGDELTLYRSRRTPPAPQGVHPVSQLSLDTTQVAAVELICRELRTLPDFPRGALHEVAASLLHGDLNYEQAKKACFDFWSRPEFSGVYEGIHELLGGQEVKLTYHVNCLWDYVGLSIPF